MMNLKKTLSVTLATAAMVVASFAPITVQMAYGEEAPAMATIYNPQPYELSIGTFIGVALESLDPNFVSGMVYQDVYDHFNNIAIHKGSRLFGHEVNMVNGRHDVLWTEIQLVSTGETYTLRPPLPATSPLGDRGLKEFRPASLAGAILSSDLRLPH
jgi:type IV secretory pathway VirB10-like protein